MGSCKKLTVYQLYILLGTKIIEFNDGLKVSLLKPVDKFIFKNYEVLNVFTYLLGSFYFPLKDIKYIEDILA
jgi:hypothetical protein